MRRASNNRYLGRLPGKKPGRVGDHPIAGLPKHSAKAFNPSGMHGYRGRRNTEYGARLTEKQKLRFQYGMLEKQFRKVLDIARKSKGNTADTIMRILETRLDNVLRRLGVAKTIWAARQIVAQGHVLVDGRKTDISSYRVEQGQTITFRKGIHKVLRDNMQQIGSHTAPKWLEWNPAQLTAKVNALPNPDDVPFEVNMNLIVEFYGAGNWTSAAAPAGDDRTEAVEVRAEPSPEATAEVKSVVLHTLEGRVEAVDEGLAYLSLVDEQSREADATCAVTELAAYGIAAGGRFRCTVIRRGNETAVRFEPFAGAPVSTAALHALEMQAEETLGDYDPSTDR